MDERLKKRELQKLVGWYFLTGILCALWLTALVRLCFLFQYEQSPSLGRSFLCEMSSPLFRPAVLLLAVVLFIKTSQYIRTYGAGHTRKVISFFAILFFAGLLLWAGVLFL